MSSQFLPEPVKSNISKLNPDDVPDRFLRKVYTQGYYPLMKYVGVFVPFDKLADIQLIILQNSFIKTKNIIFTKSTGDWKYTLIYYDRNDFPNTSILSEIKTLLSLPLKIETADDENDLSDFISKNLLA